ncbi:phosphopantetheine-binding protein [Oceanisphaera ostreae]|uniref:Phosphopantetheine-binding protein n=1 Tax=Oceanisphaera ostreae TaxID=914151 RepID=A0ABW3KE38_9GAMM
MNREDAIKIVYSKLEKNVLGLEMTESKMDQKLADLGVDSLELMLLIMDVAEAAEVTISDDQADGLDTPKKIVEFISS